MIKHLTFFCGVIGALLFIVASVLGGLQIPGYNFIGQYISESFANGLPNTGYLRLMYILSGLLLFIFGVLAPSSLPKSRGIKLSFYAFAFFYGLGNIIVSIFPCDFGCSTEIETSSLSQLIHNTSAFFTYIVVPFCLIGLGASFRKFPKTRTLSKISFVCGILSLVFVLLLFGNPTGSLIGLFQRIIEASILTWTIYCSFYVLRTVKD